MKKKSGSRSGAKTAKSVNTAKKASKKAVTKPKPDSKQAKKTSPPNKTVTKSSKKASPRKGRKADGSLTVRAEQRLRRILEMMHDQLTGQAKALKSAALHRDDDVYSAEDGSDVFERLFELSVASSELDSAFEIEEALRRMDDKTYGLCEVCDKPISIQRLEAVPYVRTCIVCQSAIEKGKIHYRPL